MVVIYPPIKLFLKKCVFILSLIITAIIINIIINVIFNKNESIQDCTALSVFFKCIRVGSMSARFHKIVSSVYIKGYNII